MAELNSTFNPLDLNNYKVEKLPKMKKAPFEMWMARLGGPLALITFVFIYWFCHIGFIDNLDVSALTAKASKRLADVGVENFLRSNYAMLAIFAASFILWMTEAIPNYLTSLLVIFGIVVTGVTSQKEALAQLGHPVMWLNILSFVLASMLVKTKFAKRLALAFVLKFGKTAKGVLWSFMVINIILSMFISATTVKATIMLPIFMVVCAIYGAHSGQRNNFGRNLVIQNLFQVNIGANAFYTGSGAHLLAISLIAGFLGSCDFGYAAWLKTCGPMSLLILVIGLLLGMYVFFPMKKDEQKPQIEGGMMKLREELDAMGKISGEEIKALGIFCMVLLLWITKGTFHNMDETIVALLGAIIALLPGVGGGQMERRGYPVAPYDILGWCVCAGCGIERHRPSQHYGKRRFQLYGNKRRHALLGTLRTAYVPYDILGIGVPIQDHTHYGIRAYSTRCGSPFRIPAYESGAACINADRARVRVPFQQQTCRTSLQYEPVQPGRCI